MSVSNLPRLRLFVSGEPLGAASLHALSELRILARLSRSTTCELFFVDPPAELVDRDLSIGLGLSIDTDSVAPHLFAGEITALEHVYDPAGSLRVRVRAQDRLHRLAKRQPVRVHRELSLGDLVRDLVAEDDCAVENLGTDPYYPRLFQYRQTDFDLLREVTEKAGSYFTLDGDTLRLVGADGVGAAREIQLGAELLEASFESRSELACRTARTSGWSTSGAEERKGFATEARIGRTADAEFPADLFGADAEWRLVDERLDDAQQADALAQAELDYRSSQELIFRGVLDGTPTIRPGDRVSVQGVAKSLVGEYLVGEVTHSIDPDRGFLTAITSELPPRWQRPWGASSALGVVVDVDDPDERGRVRVRFPTYDDLESDWLPVVVPGAGRGKGVFAPSDVDDKVLVLFPRQDMAQGVVLGGLYGVESAPGETCRGGVQRYFTGTRGQQQFVLDDEHRSVVLQNSEGSRMSLSPGKVLIEATTDIEISAPGKTITIAASLVHFRKRD
ncbi:MAG: phage baseplate assembly protein V [Planctomycetota bacterium]